MNRRMRMLFGLLLLGMALAAVVPAAEPVGAKITVINAKTGTVTAKVTATGRTFQFQVKDARLLKSLNVGQNISADLKAMTVTLPAAKPGAKAVRMRMVSGPKTKVTADDFRGERGGCGRITAGEVYENDQNMTRSELEGCCRQIGQNCKLHLTGGIKDPRDPNTIADDVGRSFQCLCY